MRGLTVGMPGHDEAVRPFTSCHSSQQCDLLSRPIPHRPLVSCALPAAVHYGKHYCYRAHPDTLKACPALQPAVDYRTISHRPLIVCAIPLVAVQYGKDYYYRAHPDDLKALYAAADEFHRMWDIVTEFNSLSTLSQVRRGQTRDCRRRGQGWNHGKAGTTLATRPPYSCLVRAYTAHAADVRRPRAEP